MQVPTWIALSSFALLACVMGCQQGSSADAAKNVKIDFSIEPKPLKVGPAQATIRLSDAGGAPVTGATLKLEGNMNHAGMKPVFATAEETSPGKYEATLDLTMGGDWF